MARMSAEAEPDDPWPLVIVNIAIIGLVVCWLWATVRIECVDHEHWRSLSPDGRREIALVLRKCPGPFLLDLDHASLRPRRAKGWGLGAWEEVAKFSDGEVARMSERPASIDEGHVVITVPADSRIPAPSRSVMGVEVTFVRRGP